MGTHGHTWGTHGHTWAPMGTHGHTWAYMGIHGAYMGHTWAQVVLGAIREAQAGMCWRVVCLFRVCGKVPTHGDGFLQVSPFLLSSCETRTGEEVETQTHRLFLSRGNSLHGLSKSFLFLGHGVSNLREWSDLSTSHHNEFLHPPYLLLQHFRFHF
jgi:hypothetical protein